MLKICNIRTLRHEQLKDHIDSIVNFCPEKLQILFNILFEIKKKYHIILKEYATISHSIERV